jgi:hypothetical protein
VEEVTVKNKLFGCVSFRKLFLYFPLPCDLFGKRELSFSWRLNKAESEPKPHVRLTTSLSDALSKLKKIAKSLELSENRCIFALAFRKQGRLAQLV